ncbi:MAG TPA: hypothetical protein PKW90_23635, partial [Myxococcota bacterium]|nr:hypothetical protein [Myxococcota bacterium]
HPAPVVGPVVEGASMYILRASSSIALLILPAGCAVYPEVSTDEEVALRLVELEQTIEEQQETITSLQSDLATLKPLATYVHVDESDPQLPAVKFVGVNVYVQSGSGSTWGNTEGNATVNGLGNLIVGYDEDSDTVDNEKSGSHNLIVGYGNEYTSFGGLVVGIHNSITGSYATALGGGNTASGSNATVTGGERRFWAPGASRREAGARGCGWRTRPARRATRDLT